MTELNVWLTTEEGKTVPLGLDELAGAAQLADGATLTALLKLALAVLSGTIVLVADPLAGAGLTDPVGLLVGAGLFDPEGDSEGSIVMLWLRVGSELGCPVVVEVAVGKAL